MKTFRLAIGKGAKYGRLSIPAEPVSQGKIKENTPQIEFIHSHRADIQKGMGAINVICDFLPEQSFILDAMAGCGFASRMFQYHWPECNLWLNDLSEQCYQVLDMNFNKVTEEVTRMDFLHLPEPKEKIDLTFIDFNTFTIQKMNYWIPGFNNLLPHSENLCIIDSASYGFKFGNLQNYYRVNTPEDYYLKLGKIFQGRWGLNVRLAVDFFASTYVLFTREKGDFHYTKEIEPVPIYREQGGLIR